MEASQTWGSSTGVDDALSRPVHLSLDGDGEAARLASIQVGPQANPRCPMSSLRVRTGGVRT